MTVERIADLDYLMEVTGIHSRHNFFNSAFSVFEWAIIESHRGRRIASISVNKEEDRHEGEEVILLPAFSDKRTYRALRKIKLDCLG